jgi:hypothetical protein
VLIVRRFIFRSLRADLNNVLAHEMVKVNVAVFFIETNLNFLRNKITPYVNSQYERTIRGN